MLRNENPDPSDTSDRAEKHQDQWPHFTPGRPAVQIGIGEFQNEDNPGFRPEGNTSGFYAGYFRDLDGNKFNAFCTVED